MDDSQLAGDAEDQYIRGSQLQLHLLREQADMQSAAVTQMTIPAAQVLQHTTTLHPHGRLAKAKQATFKRVGGLTITWAF